MSRVISVVPRNASAARALIIAALVSSVGCAHQTEQQAAQEKQILAIQARLDEAERTNGRLNVRIEGLEDDVFLLQDRVDANRIALQRRGIMGPNAQANNSQKPGPSPESYYGSGQNHNAYGTTDRAVTRIPLGGGDDRDWRIQGEARREDDAAQRIPTSTVQGGQAESDLVITEKEFDAFTREEVGPARSAANTGNGTRRQAQDPVTSEKLPTTGELGAVPPADKPRKGDALGIYKDALAHYRGGDYRQAMGDFEAFLASGPQPDYLDNALYWIGECHFGLGQYDDAVSYFQRVFAEQPDGNKVPDAMLKMSLAFDRLGRGAEATRLLEDLLRQYPATNAGRLASQKLAERK